MNYLDWISFDNTDDIEAVQCCQIENYRKFLSFFNEFKIKNSINYLD